MAIRDWRRMLRGKDCAGLRHELLAASPSDLPRDFGRLRPLEKLAVFKLLRDETAIGLFRLLPYEDKYFLLGGFPLQSLAPWLEGLEGWQRTLFHESRPALFEWMFEEIARSAPARVPQARRHLAMGERPRQVQA